MKITSIKRDAWGNRLRVISIWSVVAFASLHGNGVDFDELLEKTSYAQLLKELICMTDAIGLLHHRMDADERRFIEDSILGKMVRISRLLCQIDKAKDCVDVEYLNYWLELAKSAHIPQLIIDEIALLEEKFKNYFQSCYKEEGLL
jgi:hypothetical protein